MTIKSFVTAMIGLSAMAPNMVTPEQTAQLQQMQGLVALVESTQALTPAEMVAIFPMQSPLLNENTVTLLYIVCHANTADMSETTVSLYDFFNYIVESVMPNDLFAPYFDEATKAQMSAAKQTMDEGKAQLVGEQYSRLIISLNYELESKEIADFYTAFENDLNSKLTGKYYLVGTSAMSNELSKTFQNEYLLISIVTAIVIFLVVCLTFKKISVSALLVCIIECAVFVTMSVMTLGNVSMYFIALIIVQCVLMGSMVDYGILLSNYYLEVRKDYAVEDALPEMLKRSIRAIAISAVILITITATCGMIMVGAVASILVTLCIGSISALLLVVFALPSLLAIFDKFVIKSKKAE